MLCDNIELHSIPFLCIHDRIIGQPVVSSYVLAIMLSLYVRHWHFEEELEGRKLTYVDHSFVSIPLCYVDGLYVMGHKRRINPLRH